ncbi:MAG: phosphoribosylanthranilate isomerase [Synechococcaceae cyanobacterium]
MSTPPLLKICGLRDPGQAASVAALGVDAIGVIAVASSPRFVVSGARAELFAAARGAAPECQGVLVVADPREEQLAELEPARGHQVIQLHGSETPETCRRLRRQLGCRVWKALRLRSPADLERAESYADAVDALLLDAWMPDQLGGTGHAIPLSWLEGWSSHLPWWLAGGVCANRVADLLSRVNPSGLDASSGVEHSPGNKDLEAVRRLVLSLPGRGER